MNRPDAVPSADSLSELQLQIARRADVIARGQPKMPGLDLHCWLMAEREILGQSCPTMTAPSRPEPVASPPNR